MYRNMYGDPYITAVNINLQNQEPKISPRGGQLLTVVEYIHNTVEYTQCQSR